MSAFSSTAAVVVHSLAATLDADVLDTLKAEDFLLIHRCTRSANRTTRRAVDTQGRCFLRVDLDPVLRYQVSASVLAAEGLANYHPGRKLSAEALGFANGADLPFQFNEGPKVFIYENPTLDPGPGDLPTIEFGIAVEFADFDSETYPDTTTPADHIPSNYIPTDFAVIPVQSAVELTASCRNALLLDIWNSVNAFNDAPLTARLYSGAPQTVDNPGGTGTPLSDAITLVPWTTYSEPVVNYSTVGKNHAMIQWGAGHTGLTTRYCSHILLARNGVEVAVIPLATSLAIYPFQGIRAPIDALSVKLTYPTDGTPAPDDCSSFFLEYVLGLRTRAGTFISSNLHVSAQLADLSTALETWVVAASSTFWSVSGLTVTPVNVVSDNVAPGGGWAVEGISIYYNNGGSPGAPLCLRERHSVTVTVGNPVTLNGTPILNLATAPDP